MVNEGIPEVRKTDVETLRLRSKVSAALPPLQNVSSDPLAGYSTKAADAAQLAYETGLSYGETRANLKRNKMVSKAEDKMIERGMREMGRNAEQRRRGQQRNRVMGRNRYIGRFAGEVMGLGKDVFKVLK